MRILKGLFEMLLSEYNSLKLKRDLSTLLLPTYVSKPDKMESPEARFIIGMRT